MSLAGMCEAVMDSLQHFYDGSVFKSPKFNENWWNPNDSWKNKWKDRNPDMGERFLGSSTVFVFVTDAWHFFKFLSTTLITLAIVLCLFVSFKNGMSTFKAIMLFLIIKAVWRISFQFTYTALKK